MKTNTFFKQGEKITAKVAVVSVSERKANQIRLLSSLSILILLVVLIISNSTGMA